MVYTQIQEWLGELLSISTHSSLFAFGVHGLNVKVVDRQPDSFRMNARTEYQALLRA